MTMITFFLMILSALALPALSLLSLLLRRNILSRKVKYIALFFGFFLLFYAIIDDIRGHGELPTLSQVIVVLTVSLLTLHILKKYRHNHDHSHDTTAKGLVISEAFHSVIDGALIGATYLANPLIGYAATLGIITHETPKMLGTIAFLRSIGLNKTKTFLYALASQIGSPASAIIIYMLGKKIDHEQFHTLELASLASLSVIVFWIMYMEIWYHRKSSQKTGH